MFSRSVHAAALMAGVMTIVMPNAGCQPESFTRTFGGRTLTPDGQWTIDDILYRTYDIDHVQAYDAARAFFDRKGWDLWESQSGPTHSRVEGAIPDGRYVKIISLSSNSTGLTDIGIRVGDGDLVDSGRMLDELEQTLDGTRQANPPHNEL